MRAVCMLCRAPENAAALHVVQEDRGAAGKWRPIREAAHHTLCQPCQEWVHGQLRPILGSGDNACQLCSAELQDSFVVEVVANASRGGRSGLVKDTSRTRVCLQCFRWWLVTFRDSSAVFGAGSRAEEGPTGGWRGAISYDVESDQLSDRDRDVLETTVTTMGSQYLGELSPDSVLSGLLFLHVDGSERALDLLGTSASLASRTIVVSRQDGVENAMKCLRVGARDLLASPLTPNQVASAFEREHRGTNVERHQSGLTFVDGGKSVGAHCQQGHLFRVQPSGESMESAYLTLRRFLRAYDLVGVDSSGHLAVRLFCEAGQSQGVVARIQALMACEISEGVTAKAIQIRLATRAVRPLRPASRFRTR